MGGGVAMVLAVVASGASVAPCHQGPFAVTNAGVILSGDVLGRGSPVLMIPSLGRGPGDFSDLATRVSRAGFAVVRYEPRWFGRSDGPEKANLQDLADDAAAVLTAACGDTPAVVIGHAFGNRVARTLASRHPGKVNSVVLLAAGGQIPIPPKVSEAIGIAAAQGLKSDVERLAALELAFFAPGNDARSWLTGWSPRAAQLQGRALTATSGDDWKSAGTVPIMVLQPVADPVAPFANVQALVTQLGDRIHTVALPGASHAILPEQPRAVAKAIIRWLRGERRTPVLQSVVDRSVAK